MVSWWPGYISTDVQQLLLGISAASTHIPENHVSLWQFTKIPKPVNLYEEIIIWICMEP